MELLFVVDFLPALIGDQHGTRFRLVRQKLLCLAAEFIEIAGMQEGVAIIEKGIADRDKVVVDGQYRLTNGARIKLEEAKPEAQSPAAAAKAG